MESDDVDFDLVRAKVDAANSADLEPSTAVSIVDDQAEGIAAENGEKANDGG